MSSVSDPRISESAGGGLAAATTLAIRDRGLPLPGALALRSPWTDLSKTGDSYHTLDGLDPILRSYEAAAAAPARLYAGDHDIKNPLISPVYGDFGELIPASRSAVATPGSVLPSRSTGAEANS